MRKILVINGPNLNILGKRQVNIYGNESLPQIINSLKNIAEKKEFIIKDFQSNIEGNIISFLNEEFLDSFSQADVKNSSVLSCAKLSKIAGIIINPAGYSHTSVAIRDALEVFSEENIPIFEVHLSNIFSREEFRHNSFVSPIATGVISGLGSFGYTAALHKIIELA
ncbi:type II 3-dehydroquinate dehydratase [Fluviispira multicolorata]|uniref:3-dehydroquinate dehydratase n=1 Tax=Fluviispira multicolorata TaxID=2654512 RepID=A0A833N624_9BACT|nr:type II 3-dehydroquinate dehydratase [Fluviispira multicolorata]KAB8029169.1 type II 3-dehydroquinate dehydratase [Fluviispira multicolorata]